MVNRWIGTRLDVVCAFLAIATAAFCVAYKGILSTEMLIFSLQISMDVEVFFSIAIRFATEVHNYMASSQKIYQYTQLESEDELTKEIDR